MKISVFYCYPRSGGTLINQCLLCHPDNVVLSEVNPAGSVVPPYEQATHWFGLKDIPSPALSYIDDIVGIQQSATRAGKRLCLRDWSGINFLAGLSPWLGTPSLALEQSLYLKHAGIELRTAVILRRSASVYHSIRKSIPECADLSREVFIESYRAFLERTAHMPCFHLESFSTAPVPALRSLCDQLDLAYPTDFERRFHEQTKVTGNNRLSTRPDSAHFHEIRPINPDPALAGSPEFAALDRLARYEPLS